MATPLALDRAHQTSGTQGDTDPYVLDAAATGRQTFVDAAEEEDPGGDPWPVWYVADEGASWEVGIGTLTEGTGPGGEDEIARTTVLLSSNANNPVNWGPGTRDVFGAPSARILNAIFRTGVGVLEKTGDLAFAATPIGATGRALLDDATATDALTTLGVSAFVKTILDDANAAAVFATLGITAFVQTLLDDANAAAVLTTLGVTAYAQTILDDANAAAALVTLGVPDPATNMLRWDSGFYFESAQQTVVPGDDARIPHGLGSNPRLVTAYLICVSTGEHSYVVGDRIWLGSPTHRGGDSNRGIAFGAESDSTDLWYAVAGGDVVQVVEKSGADSFPQITSSRWRLVLQAWK